MDSYRPDIDGLRAIAVVSVLAYHGHEQWLPGGFTGVDIFFVISGYLISSLIAKEATDGRFSIARFYVRRAMRILPALFVVLAATFGLSLLLLTPFDLSLFGRSMAASATFLSNVDFWQGTGYFDTVAERKPLLHTWSLAVEEQFYLLWPLTLVAAYRFGLPLRWLVGVLVAISFTASCALAVIHQPSAFFLLPMRAWELLAGAALALGLVRTPKHARHRNLWAFAGLGLIGVGLLFLDRHSVFPGWNALWPTIGAGLVIGAGIRGPNLVSQRLLGTRPMVFIGLISYSLYLWHWPLLSLARVVERGPLGTGTIVGLLSVSFVAAILTWRFVERPFRAARVTPPPAPVLIRYALASTVVFAVGASASWSKGWVSWASVDVQRAEAARFDVNPLSALCLRWQSDDRPIAMEPCMVGDAAADRLVVWGDSHADALAPGLVAYASARGLSSHQLTMAACPPIPGLTVIGPDVTSDPCRRFNDRVLEYAIREPKVRVVALSGRWPLYVEGSRFGPDDAGPLLYLSRGEEGAPSVEHAREALDYGLTRTVQALAQAGKKVIVVGTIPPIGVNVPECLSRNALSMTSDVECASSRTAVAGRAEHSDNVIRKVSRQIPQSCAVFATAAICDAEKCRGSIGTTILYANDDHLSLAGALYVGNWLAPDLDRCLEELPHRPAARGPGPRIDAGTAATSQLVDAR